MTLPSVSGSLTLSRTIVRTITWPLVVEILIGAAPPMEFNNIPYEKDRAAILISTRCSINEILSVIWSFTLRRAEVRRAGRTVVSHHTANTPTMHAMIVTSAKITGAARLLSITHLPDTPSASQDLTC